MTVTNVMAEVAVKDLNTAQEWYKGLFGRAPDAAPMDGLIEWHLTASGGLQVFEDANRAGVSWLTLAVSNLDEQLASLKAHNINTDQTTETEFIKTVTVTDPDGNHLTFAEALK